MDAGYEPTMLVAVAQGKFVAFAVKDRWMTSGCSASSDVAPAKGCSRSASRVTGARAIAARAADLRRAPRRSGMPEHAIRHPRSGARITAIGIVTCACADVQG